MRCEDCEDKTEECEGGCEVCANLGSACCARCVAGECLWEPVDE